jgi:hypothetical protein
MINLRYQN